MARDRKLGTITFDLSGSTSTKSARLDIDAVPADSWPSGEDLFVIAGWLRFVECETTFLPADLLPLTLETIMGKMGVYFGYGTAGKQAVPGSGFKRLGTAVLDLTLDKKKNTPTVKGWPKHRDFSRQLHHGALVGMMIADSIEAISHTLDEASFSDAFYAMTFGLEKWARDGLPRKKKISHTWDFFNIAHHSMQGKTIVEGGWLTRYAWPR